MINNNDIELIKQKSQCKYIKIELLDKKTKVVLENISGELIDDSGTIDNTSNNRRTYNANFFIRNSTFLVDSNNKIWLDKYIRVYSGLLNQQNKEVVYYLIGTFVISEAGYSYNSTDNTLSLTLLDKMALIDGTLGGIINGSIVTKINRFENSYFSTLTLINEDTKTKSSQYPKIQYTNFGAGVKISIPVPKLNLQNPNDLIIKFNDFKTTSQFNNEDLLFFIQYDIFNSTINKYENYKHKYTYLQGTQGILINDIKNKNIDLINVILLQDVNLLSLSLFYDNVEIIKWNFSGDNNILDPLLNSSSKEFQDVLEYLKSYDELKNKYDSGGYSKKEENYKLDLDNIKYSCEVLLSKYDISFDYNDHPFIQFKSYKGDNSENYKIVKEFTIKFNEVLTKWNNDSYFIENEDYFVAKSKFENDCNQLLYNYGVAYDENLNRHISHGYVIHIQKNAFIYSNYYVVICCKLQDIDEYNTILNYKNESDKIYDDYINGLYDDDDKEYSYYIDDLNNLQSNYTIYKNDDGYYIVNGYLVKYINNNSQIIGNGETTISNKIKSFNYNLKSSWDTSPIIIDMTTGRENYIEDVIESGLKTLGISEFEIRNVQERIPYDQEFNVGSTWFDIFSTLISLYPNIEMFFDENGIFILQYYSNIEDDDIILTNEVLQDLTTNISYSNSLSEVYNVTELWGMNIDVDCYTENTENEPYLVKYENDNFSIIIPDLPLSDQGNLIDGTTFAFKTPNEIKLTNSPTLSINSTKANLSNITSIDKIFTCDEFKKVSSVSSKTQYQIDDDEIYSVQLNSITLYSENVKIDKKNGSKNIPNPGEKDWFRYGTRDINISYGYNIDNVIGTSKNPIIVNNIEFKGVFYNLLNASNMVKISSNGIYSIDLDNINYAIKINANKGEIFRIYYTHLNGFIYAANGKTGVFEKINRPFIDYKFADNGLSYCDFIAPSNDEFYLFYYSTDNNIGFRLYGVSKISSEMGKYEILNYNDNSKVDYLLFKPNSSYCFKYLNGNIYYLGQWQIHSVALEVLNVPNKQSDEFKYYSEIFNCNNICFTQFDSRFAVENIGIKSQVLSDGEFENIFSDDLALERVSYENWKSMRIVDKVTLTTIHIPWLDVNKKITYQLPDKTLKTYVIERISYSNTSETMTIEMSTFYPYYMQ